jgi:predicted Zn finger-like uncharacterized protein
MNPTELGRHFVVDELYKRDETRLMQCPHCKEVFMVKPEQLQMNEKFRCKACGKYNYGSHESDDWGILIGCPFEHTLWK